MNNTKETSYTYFNEEGKRIRTYDSYIDASCETITFGGYVQDNQDGRIVFALPEVEKRDKVALTCGISEGIDMLFLVANEKDVSEYHESTADALMDEYFEKMGKKKPKHFFKIGDAFDVPSLYGEEERGRVVRRRLYESGIEELDYEQIHWDEDDFEFVEDGTKTARIEIKNGREMLFAWGYRDHNGYILAV